VPAILWVGEPGDRRAVSRSDLEDAVAQLAPTMEDDVCIVLPPTPELVVALMACDRTGIVPRLLHPLDDLGPIARSRVVLTSSALVYRGGIVFLKERIDDAIEHVERVMVVDRTGWMPLGATMDVYHEVPMRPDCDVWFPPIAESEPSGSYREVPSLRGIVSDPTCLIRDEALFLYEGNLEPQDAERARAAYVGASGTSLGSRPGGRLS
jgi:acyl-coenzyme A synthetase/AMP-(fatty) acid ligase